MFDVSSDDRVLRRILGRRYFPRIFERNAKILGGDEAEEGGIS